MEGFDDNIDEDDDIGPVPKFKPDIAALNETVRAGADKLHQERPSWFPSWVRLISII